MKIESSRGKTQYYQDEAVALSMIQRIIYALKGVGFYFLFALISIFLPILHFFLVPLFLVISLYVGVTRFTCTRFIDLYHKKCPSCDAELDIKFLYIKHKEIDLDCINCRSQLKIIT